MIDAAFALFVVTLALAFCPQLGGIFAQAAESVPDQTGSVPTGTSQSARSLSKFEARRIRRRCRDQVGNSDGSKELRHCFEMHVAARRLSGECKRKAQTANLHGREKDEAVRRCVTERLQQQQSKQPSH
ncbi:MAG TPA: hypothetical protein VIF34_02345 [Methylocystis sp.]